MAGVGYLFPINPAFSVHDLHRNYTEGGPFALSGPRPVGQGPHSTDTALPAPGPANATSAAGIAFAVCSFTVAMLSWGQGDGFTGGGFVDYQWSSGHGRKQRAKNAENKRALGRSRGWVMDSLTGAASGDVRFTPKSRHWRHCKASDSKSGHPRSALPPKADIEMGAALRLLVTQSGHRRFNTHPT